jgi:flagellar hook-associated protein 2
MASPISFQGLSTNLQTDQLVNAIMDQESQGLVRMQARQTLNATRASLLQSFNSDILAIGTSLSTLNSSGFSTQTVTSSDANGTYVTASANGAATGTYSVLVNQIAKAAQLVVPQSVASSTASLGGTADGSGNFVYTLTGPNGTPTTITLSAANNTLAGLRDAIAASSSTSGVSAAVVQTDAAGTQFKLVLSATQTGLGSAGGKDITLAAGPSLGNNLLFKTATSFDTSTEVAAGHTGSVLAQNADFSVNGVEMTRTSNTVNDAVAQVTFTLKSGGQDLATGSPTTLTVATDKTAATKAMNDVVTKFNALLMLYKTNVGKDSSGNDLPFSNDSSLRGLISQVRSAITGVPAGLDSSNYYKSTVDLGIKTNRDGTMSLDSTVFQAAIDQNTGAMANVFSRVSSTAQTLINQVTSPGSGNVALIIQSVQRQNDYLSLQIQSTQKRLDRRRLELENIYANLESTVGQLQAAGQSLGSLK